MTDESRQANDKQSYEPPRLTTISLRPEEAVLGHCKTAGQSFPGFSCTSFVCGPSVGS